MAHITLKKTFLLGILLDLYRSQETIWVFFQLGTYIFFLKIWFIAWLSGHKKTKSDSDEILLIIFVLVCITIVLWGKSVPFCQIKKNCSDMR